MSKVLSIIAPKGFQDIEYGDSKKALEEEGHEVVTASTQAVAFGKFGREVEADLLLNEVNPEDYQAIIFIGGPGVYDLFSEELTLDLAKAFFQSNKIVSAICAAPSILANAGIINGKKVTCFPSQKDTISEAGGYYTGFPVEQDGLIITAEGPDSAREFGKKIAENLK